MSASRALVVYYSMTGNSKGAAEAVAAKLGADLEVIRPVKKPPRGGFALRFAIGWSRWRGKPWPVMPSNVSAISYGTVVLAGPVWLGKLAPPLISWALGNPISPSARIALLVSAVSGFFFRGALDELETIYNRKSVVTVVITESDRTTKADASKHAAFAGELQARSAAA